MKKFFSIKIKDSDKVTIYSCMNTIESGTIVLPYARKGKASCQILLTSEFSWKKCNRSYIGIPKIYNGKYIVITELNSTKGGER